MWTHVARRWPCLRVARSVRRKAAWNTELFVARHKFGAGLQLGPIRVHAVGLGPTDGPRVATSRTSTTPRPINTHKYSHKSRVTSHYTRSRGRAGRLRGPVCADTVESKETERGRLGKEGWGGREREREDRSCEACTNRPRCAQCVYHIWNKLRLMYVLADHGPSLNLYTHIGWLSVCIPM